MADTGNAPKVFKLPGRNVAARLRSAYEDGHDVRLLSKTGSPDLRRCLADLDGWTARHGTAVNTGDGWTVTFFSHGQVTQPLTYWPKPRADERWVWACRGCGAVDERWAWRDVDEASPLVRQAYNLSEGKMVDVPWACPRSGCHGQPRWQRAA